MSTNHQQRILRFDGARNVRDLGGLPTRHGATSRFGVGLRADGLSRLSEQDLTRLAALRLRTIIDLSYDEERERAPDRVSADNPPGFYFRGFYPKGTDALFHAVNIRGVGAEEAAALMCANYARMPFEHVAEFRDVMHHIISPDSAPHLVHCTSSKDRTGLPDHRRASARAPRLDDVGATFSSNTARRYLAGSIRWYINTVTLWILWIYSLISRVYAASGGEFTRSDSTKSNSSGARSISSERAVILPTRPEQFVHTGLGAGAGHQHVMTQRPHRRKHLPMAQ